MLLPVLLLIQSAAAPAPACPAQPVIPAELAGWSPHAHVTAAANGDPPLPIGRGITATLLPAASVALAAPVAKAPLPASSSGVFAITVPAAGRYRVALGAGAWVDVTRDGKALPSVAHGHGPACSPVRKMVDYDLAPGGYRLQIVGSTASTIDIMVARLR